MPFALTLIGLLLVITGFQNTYAAFGQQLRGDFTGQGNFIYWLASIAVIGGIGYIPGVEKLSRAMLALIVLALVVKVYKDNPGFFSSINSGIASGSTAATNPIGAPLPATSNSSGASSDSSASDAFASAGKDIGTIATIASFF